MLFFIYNKTTATHRTTYRMGEKRYTKIIWRCCTKYSTTWSIKKWTLWDSNPGPTGYEPVLRQSRIPGFARFRRWAGCTEKINSVSTSNLCKYTCFTKNSGRSRVRTQDRPVTCQFCGKAASLASHAFGVESVALKE